MATVRGTAHWGDTEYLALPTNARDHGGQHWVAINRTAQDGTAAREYQHRRKPFRTGGWATGRPAPVLYGIHDQKVSVRAHHASTQSTHVFDDREQPDHRRPTPDQLATVTLCYRARDTTESCHSTHP